MAGFSDALREDGSISTLEAAAPWRMAEAATLEKSGRRGAAVYLFGYAVEIWLTAACYRICGYSVGSLIDQRIRSRLVAEARNLRLMSSEPHDFAGWVRYLILIRKQTSAGYGRSFAVELETRVSDLYENWKPRMRYKAVTPSAAELNQVRDAALWMQERYNRL
jgi:hypothetical protein